jgi:hypothetical protein
MRSTSNAGAANGSTIIRHASDMPADAFLFLVHCASAVCGKPTLMRSSIPEILWLTGLYPSFLAATSTTVHADTAAADTEVQPIINVHEDEDDDLYQLDTPSSIFFVCTNTSFSRNAIINSNS